MTNKKTISLILRLGLAFAFIYPAVAAFFDPFSWIGYFPQFVKEVVPNETLLLSSFGLVEIVIGVWILSGKYIFYPSVLAAAILLSIIVFNWSQLDVIFRDISILAIALALVITSSPFRKNR